jgi:hypothetical protein
MACCQLVPWQVKFARVGLPPLFWFSGGRWWVLFGGADVLVR